MTDISQSHGVDATVVKNLTGEDIFLVWFPTETGWGRVLGPFEKVRFGGNLFEAVSGSPRCKSQMESDAASGKIAVAACGLPTTEYDVLRDQAMEGFAAHGCSDWVYESSSSAWSFE